MNSLDQSICFCLQETPESASWRYSQKERANSQKKSRRKIEKHDRECKLTLKHGLTWWNPETKIEKKISEDFYGKRQKRNIVRNGKMKSFTISYPSLVVRLRRQNMWHKRKLKLPMWNPNYRRKKRTCKLESLSSQKHNWSK